MNTVPSPGINGIYTFLRKHSQWFTCRSASSWYLTLGITCESRCLFPLFHVARAQKQLFHRRNHGPLVCQKPSQSSSVGTCIGQVQSLIDPVHYHKRLSSHWHICHSSRILCKQNNIYSFVDFPLPHMYMWMLLKVIQSSITRYTCITVNVEYGINIILQNHTQWFTRRSESSWCSNAEYKLCIHFSIQQGRRSNCSADVTMALWYARNPCNPHRLALHWSGAILAWSCLLPQKAKLKTLLLFYKKKKKNNPTLLSWTGLTHSGSYNWYKYEYPLPTAHMFYKFLKFLNKKLNLCHFYFANKSYSYSYQILWKKNMF